MRSRYLPFVGLLLLGGSEALAQQAPPQVLRITREQFKPGNMAAHNKDIPAFYALFERAGVGASRVGLIPFSGDQNHLVYIEAYPSFAEMEASGRKMEDVFGGSAVLQKEMDVLTKRSDSLHESQSVMIVVRRNDLGYRPLTIDAIAKGRFLNYTMTRVNTGRGPDYTEYVKQMNAAREKAGLDEHSTVWQVSSGAATGTFLTFTWYRSLSEFDGLRSGMDARTQKLNEALGGEAVVKQRQKLLSEIVAQSATTVYAVNREISRPSPEFLTADPTFWKPKQKQLALLAPASK
jgi:hypothetical protein